MDWQIGFLGYRPSLGELLAGFILAMLAERAWRLFSRTWDFLLDLISVGSSKMRIRQIRKLEQKIEVIKKYETNDRKVLLRFIKKLLGINVLWGMLVIINIITIKSELIINLHRIILFLHIPLPAWPGIYSSSDEITPNMILHEGVDYVIFYVMSIAIMIFLTYLASSTMREINDYADVPNTIQTLEFRISALKAKGKSD